MKILLVSLKTYMAVTHVIPIGLLYIANSLKQYQYNYEIIDLNFCTDPLVTLANKLETYRPEFVAVSIRNIAENEDMNGCYDHIRDIVSVAKKYSKVILGGAGFSLFAHEIYEYTKADYGIAGPGEAAILEIINSYKNPGHLEGIVKKLYGGFPESNIALELNSYWSRYGKYYLLCNSEIPIQTVRGCSNQCGYCSYPLINDYQLYYRNIDYVIQEILEISEYTSYHNFYFVDSVFNMNLGYTKSLLSQIISSGIKMKWRCCINPDEFDEELLFLMKKAGCVQCEVGIDSFSDEVLGGINKKYDKQKALRLIHSLEKADLPYSISLIIGGYRETPQTLNETINEISKINPLHYQVFIGTRLYPKTLISTEMNIKDGRSLLSATQDSIYISEDTRACIRKLINKKPASWSCSGAVLKG
ncbi:MAG: hypothetical protein K0R00_266 [Herbinix sp.]|jgi:radical SAM superfamily enzyme YgiQ (UPF0313 family)|nr:hypothetical protein [Herbinix sp.]